MPTPDATLAAIGRLSDEFWTPGELMVWLFAPQALLSGETPAQAILAGRADDVLRLLRQINEGVHL